mmetsp:Transcript_19010/g.64729  ORF Transcript_19010/g.64729 Transcript_19010/m.64729 type:complete len:91 (-) Transcript_19010:56-328(-)
MAPATRSAAVKLILFTVCMFAVPLYTFFWARDGGADVVARQMGWEPPKDEHGRLVYGGVLAVLAVQGVIVAYVLAAAMEPPEPLERVKDD